jgi:hypothetical protein
MTYKSSVEKSELLLDSLYLRYENDDSFRSVRDEEDDQSMRIDQSVRENHSLQDENSEDENSESENSKNSNQEDNLIETSSSAESFTEVQSVRGNLTPPPADSSQSVGVDQAASLHAAEETLVAPADQDDDDQFILADDPESDEMINDQTDNHLISDENNSLILNYSRPKIRHDYKQLHQKRFVKSAKTASIGHGLVILKTFEQVINDSQAKE